MKTTATLLILLILSSLNSFAKEVRHILEGHSSSVLSVAFSPDGFSLASGSRDNTIRLWNVRTGDTQRTLEGHTEVVLSVAFSPDGHMLASGSGDDTIRLWNVRTGDTQRTLEGHTDAVESVAFSPDGLTLASGSSDSTIRLWNVRTGDTQRTLEGHTGWVWSVAFSPDGLMLASGSRDNTIRLWNVRTGDTQRTLATGDAVYCVTFSPDGLTLASGDNYLIRLWNWRKGMYQYDLDGHSDAIYSVAFSPDSRTLASASGRHDRTARLWDVPDTRVSITPYLIESPPVGEQFGIKVDINTGQKVRGYRLTVGYDSDALKYVSHAYGDFLPGDLFTGPETTDSGRVSLNVTSPAGVGTGEGTLATMTFEVVTRTASNFYLSAILSDDDGEPLVSITEYGKVIEPPWDVNGDGAVDIFDLAIVAARFGQPGQTKADVNGDGVVDIKDLVVVASGMDAAAAAPAAYTPAIFTAAEVGGWLTQARQLNITDATVQRGVFVLENLLAALIPRETALLPNYPNPFNPETWIPYQLETSADVTFQIYDAAGAIVRTLDLGFKQQGFHISRSKAAYWDGRNNMGEQVASGVYFYKLHTPDFSATRKMLIIK